MRNKNTREVPWFRFGVRRSEAKPIFSLGSIFRLGIYFAWFNTSLSSIVRLVPFFARFNFSLGSYFRGFNFRGFSNPRKFKHSEVFDVYSMLTVKQTFKHLKLVECALMQCSSDSK